jgi:hypothetical protein
MIGALSGGDGLGGVNGPYFQQLQGVNGLTSSNSSAGGGGAGQSSVTISGPGQLLSDLQQLQTQNPAEFQQVVSQIASQLQSAAQQTQGQQRNQVDSPTALRNYRQRGEPSAGNFPIKR